MKTITFNNKYSMLKYYSKAKKNPKIKFLFHALDFQAGKYIVKYSY
jgi:hypothetical protein